MLPNDNNLQQVKWVSPPSDSLIRLVHEKEINLCLMREKMNLNIEDFQNLLCDNLISTPKIYFQLSNILGGSESFWKKRFENFREESTIINKTTANENLEFLQNLSKIRNVTINDLLQDFKVATFEYIITDYLQRPKIMFSKSQVFEPSPVNIANWVRNCEIQAEKIILKDPIKTFSKNKLEDSLGDLLNLSKINKVTNIIQQLKKLLLNCGVILIVSPSEKGNGVSGFTKKLFKNYRLIVVTDRYRNNASFWFTLLHEVAHCILHSIKAPLLHYSDDYFSLANLPQNDVFEENEANNYVEQILFPQEVMKLLQSSFNSYKKIMRLAVKYNLSSALIVAQMHRQKLAPYNHFRKFFKDVKFDSIH